MKQKTMPLNRPRLGIALGSGAARGWAHIGVLRALEEAGIVPDIVAGTSIGALVGAAYASDRLDSLEEWVVQIDWWEIIRYMDLRLGGVEGDRLMLAFRERVEDALIENLPKPFGAVATDLYTGREVWFQEGSLLEAVRASIALPGLFSPMLNKGRWLVDGGLVDPLPVSLCRALGAEQVIAINLNGDIVGRHLNSRAMRQVEPNSLLTRLSASWQSFFPNNINRSNPQDPEKKPPGLLDVIAGAINIMQDRITRTRLAGDPPDIVLAPKLAHVGLMDFDHAAKAITAGMECVRLYLPLLTNALNQPEVDR